MLASKRGSTWSACAGTGQRPRAAVLVAAVAVLAAVGVSGCQAAASSAAPSSATRPAAASSAAQPTPTKAAPLSPLTWSAARAPLPQDATGVTGQNAMLTGVSCAAPGNCMAVGYDLAHGSSGNVYQAFAETLSDGRWTPAAVPGLSSPTAAPLLSSVSCPVPGTCVAIGGTMNSSKVLVPVIEQFSGGGWHSVEVPLPTGLDSAISALLTDVHCTTANWCVAAGWYTNTGGGHEPFADTLSGGSWTAGAIPLPSNAASGGTSSAATDTFLSGVSCTGTGACAASGQYHDAAGGSQGFLSVLSGGTWTTVQAPLPGDAETAGQQAGSWAINCPAAGACVAGGHYLNADGQARYLIDTQSGGTWIPATAPLPADAAANQKWSQDLTTSIGGVACESVGNCVATAGYVTTGNELLPTLATLSNGTWTTATAPLPPDADPAIATEDAAYLVLVTCPAAGSCVTVGAYQAADRSYEAMIETAS